MDQRVGVRLTEWRWEWGLRVGGGVCVGVLGGEVWGVAGKVGPVV